MELSNGAQVFLAQAIELPDFSGLPPFAQGVMYTAAAVAVGLSILIPRIGYMFGKKSEPKGEASVAAVIVDPTALNAHTAATNRVADELAEIKVQLQITREVGIRLRRSTS